MHDIATDADRIGSRIKSMDCPIMVRKITIRLLRRYGPSIGLWTG
jgi:hypothetical protein